MRFQRLTEPRRQNEHCGGVSNETQMPPNQPLTATDRCFEVHRYFADKRPPVRHNLHNLDRLKFAQPDQRDSSQSCLNRRETNNSLEEANATSPNLLPTYLARLDMEEAIAAFQRTRRTPRNGERLRL